MLIVIGAGTVIVGGGAEGWGLLPAHVVSLAAAVRAWGSKVS
jgi:hypothetical protein